MLGRPNSSSSSSYTSSPAESSSSALDTTSHLSEEDETALLYGRLSGESSRDDRSDGVGDARFEEETGGVLGREL